MISHLEIFFNAWDKIAYYSLMIIASQPEDNINLTLVVSIGVILLENFS